MADILQDTDTAVSKKRVNPILRLLKATGRWAARSWLPVVWMLVGAILVLSQDFVEVFARPLDQKVVSWWHIGGPTQTPRAPEAPEALQAHHGNQLLTGHFFGEVGIAFIVAGLIGIFVEGILREREKRQNDAARDRDIQRHQTQMKELKENVFKHVLGGFAPAWMYEKVVNLYKAKFLRVGLELTYTFEGPPKEKKRLRGHRMPEPSDLVTVSVQIRYIVENLAAEATDPSISHGFEPTVPTSREDHSFTQLTVKKPKGSGDGGKGTPHEIIMGRGASQPGHSGENAELEWQKGRCNDPRVECPIPPEEEPLGWKNRTITVRNFTMNQKSNMEVTVLYQSIRWKYDQETWVSRLPADGLRVVVEVKSDAPPLEFSLVQLHPTTFTPTGQSTWELKDQVLPYQGFTLHWFPAPDGLSEPPPSVERPSATESAGS